jgi:D-alanyl-D-alanine carboxypeptidase (penicillin-binding protein 5/6)
MKRFIISLALIFGITSAIADTNLIKSQAQALQPSAQSLATPAPQPAQPLIVPAPPNINATGYVLMDANSGKILAQKNMNKEIPPASLTKLMTLYITEQALAQGQIQLTDKVRVSKTAWQRGGSRMFLKLGALVPVQQLIEGVIVASGNDACTALAEYIAGNETSFANLMNQTAKRLGMKNTHYVDSTGLPRSDHYSTPYDLALLARHIITDFPQYYPFFKQKWITYNGIRQPNRNRLLWRAPGVDGLKTGHTKAAGYCLISSGVQHGMRLISVVVGTPTDAARANDSQALLNWGFRFYKTYKLYGSNQAITTPRIYMGQNKQVAMGLQNDLYVTIAAGEYDLLKASMELAPKLKAPIVKGQSYGTISVTLAGKQVAQAPLVALQDDPVGGAWTRMTDHVSMFIKGL